MSIPLAAKSLMPVPTMNERNEPRPTLIALFKSFRLCINSPTNAPMKGPAIIPNGPRKKPPIAPIVAPTVAGRLPPKILVIYAGIK